ncbi:MAG: hypothetical protein RLY16_1503 [Bacteroidota bacterium]
MATDKQKLGILILLSAAFLSYSFYIYSVPPIQTVKLEAAADKGKMIWQQYNCNSCHQIYGQGGYIGPDLTNVYSQRSKTYIQTFLSYGSFSMPNFHLTPAEQESLLHYLKQVDASGKSDLRTFKINNDGTIEQQSSIQP